MAGERLAEMPGALSAVARLAAATGARLAWVPRRAGERGAMERGRPAGSAAAGRPVADPEARAEVARAWGVAALPAEPGRDGRQILAAAPPATWTPWSWPGWTRATCRAKRRAGRARGDARSW